MNEEKIDEIGKNLSDSEDYHLKQAIEHLKQHNDLSCDYLVDAVAALCDIDRDLMMSNSGAASAACARGLFWYAYRYMTNETYEKIAELTFNKFGYKYTKTGIALRVNKTRTLISEEPIWEKRWSVLKKIIKMNDNSNGLNGGGTIVISVPKELKDTIKIKIQEK